MSVLLFKLSEVSARPASGAFYAVIVPSADWAALSREVTIEPWHVHVLVLSSWVARIFMIGRLVSTTPERLLKPSMLIWSGFFSVSELQIEFATLSLATPHASCRRCLIVLLWNVPKE
jgi:hypothetical protein